MKVFTRHTIFSESGVAHTVHNDEALNEITGSW